MFFCLYSTLNFVKELDKTGPAFKYLLNVFPCLSEAKLKEGIFIGPQIKKVLKDVKPEDCLSTTEKAAWRSFKLVVKECLGNKKNEKKQIVSDLLVNYNKMGVKMSLKIHFLHAHFDFFLRI